jgi:hypothetical protein
MSLPGDLVRHLLSDPGVSAIIGTRLDAGRLKAGQTLPAMAYQVISGPRDHTLTGSELAQPRYQLTAFAATYLEAHTLAKSAQAAMDGWYTAYRYPAYASDPYDIPGEAEAGIYAVAVDVEIWHR